ncbi:CATRA system-associated protein [Micromonospora sp. NPDC002389]|uniref:CATRA system-associated protein n=1 Tax=Micromonospora sp. NPDC002389 TaxID=3154272 RepID=UPI0033212300
MDAIDDADAAEILDEAAETLRYVRACELSPAEWKQLDEAVRRMQEALDRGDLAAVRFLRGEMDRRSYRQSAKAELAEPSPSIPSPRMVRTASENLEEQMKVIRQRYPRDPDEQSR